MGIKYPLEAILKSKELKEEGNKIFISKAYRMGINLYDKALQYLCVFASKNENDATSTQEHGIAINLNIVACWLKLNEFELAKCKCDLVMKLD